MTWLQTHGGRAFDLASPDPADVRIGDTAHALAHINRYNGHAGVYSVAEHCCHVADYLDREGEPFGLVLAGLLHDAPEAYVGDMTRPMQQALGKAFRTEFQAIHERAWHAIRAALAVPAWVDIHCRPVRMADGRICLDERDALLGASPRPPGDGWPDALGALGVTIRRWSPDVARDQWLSRFDRLMVEVRRGV